MTDIEKKALVLVNETAVKFHTPPWHTIDRRSFLEDVICRAIEQHEAFRQEVSEEIMRRWPHGRAPDGFGRFIIPKPDPLAEAWIEATGNTVGMGPLNEAIAKRGGKIVWGEG